MLRAISHRDFWLILIFTILMFSVQALVSSGTPEVYWQSSQEPIVQLGIRDKNGSLGKFTALCAVRAPDGNQYEAKVMGERDKWGYVYFPDDFKTWSRPGRYFWRCLVNGQEVASGGFEFTTVKISSDQVRVYR